MKPIPIFRAAHLLPYIHFLKIIGAPVERGLRQIRLPTNLAERHDVYLPLTPAIAFLRRMDMAQGIDELGLRALQGMKVNDLSECFVAALDLSPTLLSALDKFRELSYIDDPNLHFSITLQRTKVKLNCLSLTSLDPHGQRYDDWGNLLPIVAIVQAFAGPTWHPKEMGFCSHFPLSRFASEQFPNTRFLIGRETGWITVPRDLLSLPLWKGSGTADARLPSEPEPQQAFTGETASDFLSSLKRILPPYLSDGYPPIELAAEIAGTSVRTLQRRLRQYNTNYSDLIRRVRFEVASTLLRNTDSSIINIAYEVGYSDPTHLTRAFRSLAGTCPSRYRHQHRLH